MRKRIIDRGGFTLIEIVVALAVLAIAMAALLSTMNMAIKSVANSAQLTQAVTMARGEMERYRMRLLAGEGSQQSWSTDDEGLEEDVAGELRIERAMEPTTVPGAFELIVSVYKGAEKDSRMIFELRQYVVLGESAENDA